MHDGPGRPASFEAYLELLEARRAATAQAVRPETVFEPRATEVVISPFGKCGTTWLQQIVHTLRTRGDTDFDDISRVVPWIETSRTLGLDLDTWYAGNTLAMLAAGVAFIVAAFRISLGGRPLFSEDD